MKLEAERKAEKANNQVQMVPGNTINNQTPLDE